MKYHSYEIVTGHQETLVKKVNEKLKAGYDLIGGVCALPPGPDLSPQEDFLFQAVAIKSRSSN
jgi:hypothetical protein